MTTSTHVCEVSSDEMDPTTRDAGARPRVVCLQKYDLQARERLVNGDPDASLSMRTIVEGDIVHWRRPCTSIQTLDIYHARP
jgi:hypothetical protein